MTMSVVVAGERLVELAQQARSAGLSVPTMMRSGFMKSSIAAPSFRNSGLETTSNSMPTPRAASASAMRARTLSAVPTGTVDLVTTTR